MAEIFRKTYALLDEKERRWSLLVLAVFIIRGVLEVASVASVMPFMAVVGNPAAMETSRILASAHAMVGSPSPNRFLALLGGAVFFLLIASLACSAFAQWYMERFAQQIGYRLSMRLLKVNLARPYSWFLQENSANLGRIILHEVGQVVGRCILPLLRIVSRVVLVLLLSALILVANPSVALMAAAGVGGLYAIIYLLVRRYLWHMSREVWRANEERYLVLNEAFGGIKDVKLNGLERAYVDRFKDPAKRNARYYAHQIALSTVPKYFLEAFVFGAMILILIVMLLMRDSDIGLVLPIIALYAFAGYRLMPALQEIYNGLADLQFGSTPLDHLYGELVPGPAGGITTGPVNAIEGAPAISVGRSIEIQSVTFAYPGATTPSLDCVSLKVPANSCVAFVGPTGAGKTTIVDILMGLLTPDAGHLLVDEVPITTENIRQWQANIGYVPQQIFLSDSSIAQNIAFGESIERIDMAAVERAARLAKLHEFVERDLPAGYHTEIGERGVRLSGGQRQRIGIARALYRNPGVLVLDEATSALDNITENEVMEAVKNLANAKTIIMIAHRLSTVMECDTIYLMERGRMVAAGSFDQLQASNSTFHEMVATADRSGGGLSNPRNSKTLTV